MKPPIHGWFCILRGAKGFHVERNAFHIGRDWESVKTALEGGVPLDAPIIMKRGDQTHLVSGNTRLMVARAMGIRPQVWVFEVDGVG